MNGSGWLNGAALLAVSDVSYVLLTFTKLTLRVMDGLVNPAFVHENVMLTVAGIGTLVVFHTIPDITYRMLG